jgi:hypothetical protein
MGEAPEVFRVGRVGKVSLIQERPSPALRTKVEAAVNRCPTGTLWIEELPRHPSSSNEPTGPGADGPTGSTNRTANSAATS